MKTNDALEIYKLARCVERYVKLRLDNKHTLQGFELLRYLTNAEKPTTINAIARHLDLDSSAVSTLIARYERKDYVVRTHGKEDRRNVFVNLTLKGAGEHQDYCVKYTKALEVVNTACSYFNTRTINEGCGEAIKYLKSITY